MNVEMKMDRDYFKEKRTGKKPKGRYTKCCNQENDRHILNKKNKEDWKLIEQYCEDQLLRYSSTETIEPICCKKCGRLIEYKSIVNKNAWNG